MDQIENSWISSNDKLDQNPKEFTLKIQCYVRVDPLNSNFDPRNQKIMNSKNGLKCQGND